MNVTHQVGRLVKDPELQYTTSGTALCKFTIAQDTGTKEKPYTSYLDCVAWKNTGEAIAQYVKKGQRIGIDGSLKQDRWEKDGKKQSRIIINVFKFYFIEKKSSESQAESMGTVVQPEDIPGGNPFNDDNIPPF